MMNKITLVSPPSIHQLKTYPFLIFSFQNPPRTNLCFCNAVTSLLLNTPPLKQMLSENSNAEISKGSCILQELYKISKERKFGVTSTVRLRYLTKRACMESGQKTKNFSNNQQHDAAEFLFSVLEHTFTEPPMFQNFKEKIFGGLLQTTFTCHNCSKYETSHMENMPEIIPLQLIGENLQVCLDNLFEYEVIQRNCSQCPSILARKQFKTVLEPDVMILQMKRFEYDNNNRVANKKHNLLFCPPTLKMQSGSIYTLQAIVNHIGSSPNQGHYNLVLYDSQKDNYILLDDKNININFVIDDNIKRTHYLIMYYKNQ